MSGVSSGYQSASEILKNERVEGWRQTFFGGQDSDALFSGIRFKYPLEVLLQDSLDKPEVEESSYIRFIITNYKRER